MDTVFADDRCDVDKPAPHSRSECGRLKKEEEESTGDGGCSFCFVFGLVAD